MMEMGSQLLYETVWSLTDEYCLAISERVQEFTNARGGAATNCTNCGFHTLLDQIFFLPMV